MYTIPFHREAGFRPDSIPGNKESDTPVEFELSMAAGADRARLKSILVATVGTAGDMSAWSPAIQQSVAESFKTGPQLFANTVTRIANLTAPAILCRRVGVDAPKDAKDDDPVAITTGRQFALVAPYMVDIAFEVACEIQRLTINGAIDHRFTAPSSGSPKSPAASNGTATAAPTTNDDGATAGSADPAASSPTVM